MPSLRVVKCLILTLAMSLLCGYSFAGSATHSPETHCKALTVYKEAGGESLVAQRAVLDVLETRIKLSRSSCKKEVSLLRQFSWHHAGVPLKAKQSMLTTYEKIVKMKPVMQGATHFHHIKSNPKWAKKMGYVGRLGNHYFYRAKEK